MKDVIILGSGGQARVLLEAIESQNLARILGFIGRGGHPHPRYANLGQDGDLERLKASLGPFEILVAIGASKLRQHVVSKIEALGTQSYFTVIHHQAILQAKYR
jgi:hypothetical protein